MSADVPDIAGAPDVIPGGLPPLSISTGPTVSGGPTESGPASTGDFRVVRGNSGFDAVAAQLPMIAIIALGAWMLMRR